MKRSYPNPTFLTKAENIKKKRLIRVIVILVALAIISGLCFFISYQAKLQKEYIKLFPELVGHATRETTEEETTSTETSEETEETIEETEEESVLAPIVQETTASESTEDPESTTTNLHAFTWQEIENVSFRSSHPLQTITHEERDVYLDDLKQDLTDYINLQEDTYGDRICVRYVSLSSRETLGINDLDPIIPAGAFSLPVELLVYRTAYTGNYNLNRIITYQGSNINPATSYIISNFGVGQEFTARTLLNYAIAKNDTLALMYLLDNVASLDKVWNFISPISSYVDYLNEVTYMGRNEQYERGNHRSSCYDMCNYLEYLYDTHINEPEVYQQLINDMSLSEIPNGLAPFGEDALLLSVSGRNEDTNSYTLASIVDDQEPFALVIYAECSSHERAIEIQSGISTYINNYMTICHN